MRYQVSQCEVLIATLGSEPQVVTLVLDLLRSQGYPIAEVIVVHTSNSQEPIRSSLSRLKGEREHYRRLSPPIAFKYAPITGAEGGQPADIITEADAAETSFRGAVFRTLYRLVLDAKRAGCRVHLSMAGGRKVMSVYGLAVAQLLFDEDDCLWHLLSEGKLLAEKRMHAAPGEEPVLIPVPVLRWSSVSPVATELALTEDPYLAVQKQRQMRETESARRKLDFLQHTLTEAERELLELLVREPMPNKHLARRLHRSPKTVANQLSSIYSKFESHFPTARPDRSVLIAEFAGLVAERPRGPWEEMPKEKGAADL